MIIYQLSWIGLWYILIQWSQYTPQWFVSRPAWSNQNLLIKQLVNALYKLWNEKLILDFKNLTLKDAMTHSIKKFCIRNMTKSLLFLRSRIWLNPHYFWNHNMTKSLLFLRSEIWLNPYYFWDQWPGCAELQSRVPFWDEPLPVDRIPAIPEVHSPCVQRAAGLVPIKSCQQKIKTRCQWMMSIKSNNFWYFWIVFA
jgi:hypothetical protein